jgi:hypothetical protein
LRPVVALAWLAAVAWAPPAAARSEERPTLRVGELGAGSRVDGVLDEPAWVTAPQSADLVMVEPRPGDRPNGRGFLKVLAGPKALVFGIRCEDPDPGGIVSFTKERDGDFEVEDHVVVVLDPFQDGRSGYVFAVNPGGARFDDALVEPGGEGINKSWDGERSALSWPRTAGSSPSAPPRRNRSG